MVLFAGLAMAVYVRVVVKGLTVRRAFWMSVWASFAISSKELAGPMFLLPYMGLGVYCYVKSRGDELARRIYWRAIGYTLVAGVGTYLLLNVVYAPTAWWARMQHWVLGEGTSSAIWGGGLESGELTYGGYMKAIGVALLNNFGPGGIVVAVIAVVSLVFVRGKWWGLWALWPMSIFLLGLLPLGYVVDRFYIIFTLSMLLLVIGQLDAIADRLRTMSLRCVLSWCLAFLVALNLYWATFALIYPKGNYQYMIERDLQGNISKNQSVNVFALHRGVEGKSRLAYLGYRVDSRSISQIVEADVSSRPNVIYANKGQLDFVLDARKYPARARMLEEENGLDIAGLGSLEELGYREVREVQPRTPSWFVLGWMPAVEVWKQRDTLQVYVKQE